MALVGLGCLEPFGLDARLVQHVEVTHRIGQLVGLAISHAVGGEHRQHVVAHGEGRR